MTSVTMTVSVDLAEVDIGDLLEELERRGHVHTDDVTDEVRLMAEAFYVGNNERALELAKQIARTATGLMIS